MSNTEVTEWHDVFVMDNEPMVYTSRRVVYSHVVGGPPMTMSQLERTLLHWQAAS